MNTICNTASTSPILAIDLGKYKSVACAYRAGAEAWAIRLLTPRCQWRMRERMGGAAYRRNWEARPEANEREPRPEWSSAASSRSARHPTGPGSAPDAL